MTTDPISLYFHIPFCRKKCDYCHFFVLPNRQNLHTIYLSALHQEIERVLPYLTGKNIESIYFGGGTPYLIGPEAVARILQKLPVKTGVEITLEANPGEIDPQSIQLFQKAGVNRISLGVQSLQDQLLKTLTRQHSVQHVYQALDLIRTAGIDNVSIDLMYEVPGQTLEIWEQTLWQTLALPITHLSAYNLTFEPGTPFFKRKASFQPAIPTEETSAKMYRTLQRTMKQGRWVQYEISAFAKPGYPSHHNTGYWTGRPFFGLGPSAFSYWEGSRFQNVAHLNTYAKKLERGEHAISFREKLHKSKAKREMLGVSLRMLKGIDIEAFEKKYSPLEERDIRNIKKLVEEGLLVSQKGRLSLSQQGILFYDSVAETLL